MPDLILAVNAAEERLQLALGRLSPDAPAPEFLAGQEWLAPGQVMSHLAPMIHQTMERLGRPVSDLTRIACVRGPGSFTGLRLSLATTLGLARALDIPLAGLELLPILAHDASAALPAAEGRTLWVMTYARRAQVYIQGFDCVAAPLDPPQAVRIEEAVEIIGGHGGPAALMGSGLRRQPEFFAQRLPEALFLPSLLDSPRPEALLAAAAEAQVSTEPIEPLYLRASDAEENLEAIAAKRGLDPAKAREALETLRSS